MSSQMDFSLPETLTIAQAHALHDEFESLLGKDNIDECVLHAQKVTRIDTAGLQLLLAFVNAGRERQIAVVWHKPSDKLLESSHILGLHNALGLH